MCFVQWAMGNVQCLKSKNYYCFKFPEMCDAHRAAALYFDIVREISYRRTHRLTLHIAHYMAYNFYPILKNKMKKYALIAISCLAFAACANRDKENPNDTSTVTTTTTTEETIAYKPVDGDMMYSNGKLMVMRNGTWVEADDDVKVEGGIVVYRNGHVTREDKTVVLSDGEIVDHSGNILDRTGRAIDNAWQDTKQGVKEVGREARNAAKEVGQEAKEAVDGKKN
jgi:hypothetical protein